MMILTTLVISDLPVPESSLNPNKGTSSWALRRLRRQQRRDAGLTARSVLGPDAPRPVFPVGVRVRVDAVVRWPSNGFWDDDNFIAAMKGAIDGLADAGCVANDRQLRWGMITWVNTKGRRGGVDLTLTAEEG